MADTYDYDEAAPAVDLSDEADALREKLNAAERSELAEDTECRIGQNVPPSAAALRAQAEQMLADAARLDRQEALDRQRARLARRPVMPEITNPGDSAVVVFNRYQSGKDYGYAAHGWREGSAVRWVVTGQNTERFNWQGLLEWIGEANWHSIHVVTDVKRIGPDPEDDTPLREVMGSYGRVERTEAIGVDPFAAGGYVGGLDLGGLVVARVELPRGQR
jgi:hypothetical protein